jgi:hypothetical protein
MAEYEPDPIVMRAATQRAERLSHDEYVCQLADEMRDRNEAVDWYGPTVASYRPDLLIGTLRAAPQHSTLNVYGLLIQLSEMEAILPSDGLVRALSKKYMVQFENGVIRDHHRATLLRSSSTDAGILLKPAAGSVTKQQDDLLRSADSDDER